MTRWTPSAAVLLVCTCLAMPAQAAVLPTDLESKVDANPEATTPDERAMWDRLALLEEALSTSPMRLDAPELDAYTRRVVERLIGRPAPELRIYLMRDASFNAAMFPSGMMIVNTGVLVRVRNEAQFAAVLGHEIGHYYRNHSLARHRDVRHSTAMATITTAAEQNSTFNDRPESWRLITQAIVESAFRFSRSQESEADAYALMMMARAGYSPQAASAICEQLNEERRSSAELRGKRYIAAASAELSTHPTSRRRIIDLTDTAEHLTEKSKLAGSDNRDEWLTAIRPYQALLLQQQINLNDPGASFYLLDELAKDGWTGVLRFYEGEAYRLRGERGDEEKAAESYADAVALEDAPPEAWRAHGYSLLKAGKKAEAYEALDRYLAMNPEAPDAAMILFTQEIVGAAAGSGNVLIPNPGPEWKKVGGDANQSRWEEVWTWSGPQIDRLAVISGLPDGKSILFKEKKSEQQVPVFKADMTLLDLVSMLEVSYRINGVTVFEFESLEPVDFAGGPGIGMSYNYASGLGIEKRGICLMRVVDHKLYAMRLESVARHFDKVAPEFDQLLGDRGPDHKGP